LNQSECNALVFVMLLVCVYHLAQVMRLCQLMFRPACEYDVSASVDKALSLLATYSFVCVWRCGWFYQIRPLYLYELDLLFARIAPKIFPNLKIVMLMVTTTAKLQFNKLTAELPKGALDRIRQVKPASAASVGASFV
jgi:hypothetical protein